jgi:hypothetical protein
MIVVSFLKAYHFNSLRSVEQVIYGLYRARIATSGDRRDAFHAGNIPAARVMLTDRSHTRTRSFGRKMGVICEAAPPEAPNAASRYARPIPVPIPIVDPIRPMTTASLRNIDRINKGFAPIAFIVPISFVLSFTDVLES